MGSCYFRFGYCLSEALRKQKRKLKPSIYAFCLVTITQVITHSFWCIVEHFSLYLYVKSWCLSKWLCWWGTKSKFVFWFISFWTRFGNRGIIKGRDCELRNHLISISYSVLSFYRAFCCANENSGQFRRIRCFKDQKVLRGSRKTTKKLNALNNFLDERALSNILWWKEVCYFILYQVTGQFFILSLHTFIRHKSAWDLQCKPFLFLFFHLQRMQMCRKPSTVQLVKRLEYSNLLGLDVNLKNGRWDPLPAKFIIILMKFFF